MCIACPTLQAHHRVLRTTPPQLPNCVARNEPVCSSFACDSPEWDHRQCRGSDHDGRDPSVHRRRSGATRRRVTVRHPTKLHNPPAYATCSTSGGRLDPLQDGPHTVTDSNQHLENLVNFTPLQTATKYRRGAFWVVDVL